MLCVSNSCIRRKMEINKHVMNVNLREVGFGMSHVEPETSLRPLGDCLLLGKSVYSPTGCWQLSGEVGHKQRCDSWHFFKFHHLSQKDDISGLLHLLNGLQCALKIH